MVQFFLALAPAEPWESLTLRVFNLLYYIPGLTDVGLDEMDRREWMRYFKLLQERKEEEAKPPKKE